jgi:hypothetical protein
MAQTMYAHVNIKKKKNPSQKMCHWQSGSNSKNAYLASLRP